MDENGIVLLHGSQRLPVQGYCQVIAWGDLLFVQRVAQQAHFPAEGHIQAGGKGGDLRFTQEAWGGIGGLDAGEGQHEGNSQHQEAHRGWQDGAHSTRQQAGQPHRSEQADRSEGGKHQPPLTGGGHQRPADQGHEDDTRPEDDQAKLKPARRRETLHPMAAPDIDRRAEQAHKRKDAEEPVYPAGRGNVQPPEKTPIGHDKAPPFAQELP